MTVQAIVKQSPVARDGFPEKFQDAAYAELQDCPMHVHGECFLPECSSKFNPTRESQIYCCHACERKGTSEVRKWAHRAGMAMLAWGMARHPKGDAEKARTSAAMKHLARVQRAWIVNRKDRRKAALALRDQK